MKLHWSDWNRACISAAVLLALAALAVFKIPHGFEEGVGWYLCLLPGAIFAAAISDLIQNVIPQSKSIVFDTLLISFNFLWYFVISHLPLKTYRFISATLRIKKVLAKWTYCGVLGEVPVTDQKRRPGKLRRHKSVILMVVNGGKM